MGTRLGWADPKLIAPAGERGCFKTFICKAKLPLTHGTVCCWGRTYLIPPPCVALFYLFPFLDLNLTRLVLVSLSVLCLCCHCQLCHGTLLHPLLSSGWWRKRPRGVRSASGLVSAVLRYRLCQWRLFGHFTF